MGKLECVTIEALNMDELHKGFIAWIDKHPTIEVQDVTIFSDRPGKMVVLYREVEGKGKAK